MFKESGIKTIVIMNGSEPMKCLGSKTWTEYGYEYDCDYPTEISCDECVFLQAAQCGDKRSGKRPWAKCNSAEF